MNSELGNMNAFTIYYRDLLSSYVTYVVCCIKYCAWGIAVLINHAQHVIKHFHSRGKVVLISYHTQNGAISLCFFIYKKVIPVHVRVLDLIECVSLVNDKLYIYSLVDDSYIFMLKLQVKKSENRIIFLFKRSIF